MACWAQLRVEEVAELVEEEEQRAEAARVVEAERHSQAARQAGEADRRAQVERQADALDLAQLYSPVYLLIVEGEGLVTSCISLSLLSLSPLSPSRTKPVNQTPPP